MITREQYKDINYKPFLFFVVFGARGDQLEVSGSRHHVEGMPEGLEFNCLNRSEHADYIDDFFEGPLGDILQEENSDLLARCREAEDCAVFSQDGFSDINQINRILNYIPSREGIHILDIGCGNGKMLGYLQDKTNAYIHGFDYSENAIDTAKRLFQTKADFKQGYIGEIDYPAEQFDLIVSMDTMYFSPDMEQLVQQIMKWLKKDGVLFVGYQEGDVMPKTDNEKTTILAKVFDKSRIQYEVENITQETYELLKKKREAALLHQRDFEEEGNKDWFDMLMLQTDCVTYPYDVFAQRMARYIYIARKTG